MLWLACCAFPYRKMWFSASPLLAFAARTFTCTWAPCPAWRAAMWWGMSLWVLWKPLVPRWRTLKKASLQDERPLWGFRFRVSIVLLALALEVLLKIRRLSFCTGDRVVAAFDIACGQCSACQLQNFSGCDSTNPSLEMEKLYNDRCVHAVERLIVYRIICALCNPIIWAHVHVLHHQCEQFRVAVNEIICLLPKMLPKCIAWCWDSYILQEQ